MTTHRRYCFTYAGKYPANAHEKTREVLERWCERRWWYNEPEVEGFPFDRLVLSVTVSARDQWWCHRRAIFIAMKCWRAIHLRSQDLPVPLWEPLEPHDNRGHKRVPAASVGEPG